MVAHLLYTDHDPIHLRHRDVVLTHRPERHTHLGHRPARRRVAAVIAPTPASPSRCAMPHRSWHTTTSGRRRWNNRDMTILPNDRSENVARRDCLTANNSRSQFGSWGVRRSYHKSPPRPRRYLQANTRRLPRSYAALRSGSSPRPFSDAMGLQDHNAQAPMLSHVTNPPTSTNVK